ncbi:peroxiredoxin [Methylomonas sp. SURF-1]|uniref:thioredoxin-dependent peroxiredoxin n=1 Tax=Methylomonas aurea TaxID=2952224 RepID=A0ABT1UIT7_9GAMM|nr:peroxiredoxin [Methylomonas sp. SURF-1]MCQ8181931.1 peroxiredoxin [Methylomonas sp. SURF-1]
MKRFIGASLLCLTAAFSALADLELHDFAPDIDAQASYAGKPLHYSLRQARAKGPVVVYFYPTAFGRGCSVQARAFAEHYAEFTAAGASIVGVSLDGIERLNQFSADPNTCAGKFPVASDPDGKIANAYGLAVDQSTVGRLDSRGTVVDHGSIARTTFVVGADGKVLGKVGDLKPAENVAKALEIVKAAAANARS